MLHEQRRSFYLAIAAIQNLQRSALRTISREEANDRSNMPARILIVEDEMLVAFELESILIEHEAVAEAGVVPSPDSIRLSVPKAFVSLRPGAQPDAATARSILAHARERLGPFKRIRRIEFFELPKTISGKVKRAELRQLEAGRRARNERGALEWTEEELADR